MYIRKFRCLQFAALFVGLISPGLTQSDVTDENREADHELLRTLLRNAQSALNNQDMDAFGSYLTEDFVFTGADQSVFTSIDDLRTYRETMFEAADAPLESLQVEPVAEVLTRFLSPNVGYCYGTSRDTYTLKSGRSVEVESRWSAVCVKEEGNWKITLLHDGVNFYDNPVISRISQYWLNLAIGLAIAGLILGAILGFLVRRRRS